MDIGTVIVDQLIEMMSSAGIAGFESPATVKVPVNQAEWISKRYGCDYRSDHHSRSRCKLQGRISQLKLTMAKTTDPNELAKLQSQLVKWNGKLQDEIRRSRFRKD